MPENASSVLLKLPLIAQSQLDVRPIDWGTLPKRFLNPGELEVLIALVQSVNPARVVEFGIHEGRTAAAILHNVQSVCRYIGVDVLPGYVPKCAVQRREAPKEPGILAKADVRFQLILRERGTFDLTIDDVGEADVVFIDGDHGREAVMHDTMLATKIVNKGGLIVWHDYHALETVEVRPVLEELQASGREIVHVENTWIAFERW